MKSVHEEIHVFGKDGKRGRVCAPMYSGVSIVEDECRTPPHSAFTTPSPPLAPPHAVISPSAVGTKWRLSWRHGTADTMLRASHRASHHRDAPSHCP